MMTRDEWLKQIQDNPTDWQAVLIFADWLEEQGEELEAEQWRFAVQWGEGGTYKIDPYWLTDLFHFTAEESWIRDSEKKWCDQNNIRFIPFFPRTLADLETIRSGTE